MSAVPLGSGFCSKNEAINTGASMTGMEISLGVSGGGGLEVGKTDHQQEASFLSANRWKGNQL